LPRAGGSGELCDTPACHRRGELAWAWAAIRVGRSRRTVYRGYCRACYARAWPEPIGQERG
jgi:hypothetical protein